MLIFPILSLISGQKTIQKLTNTITFITEMTKSAEAQGPFMEVIAHQK